MVARFRKAEMAGNRNHVDNIDLRAVVTTHAHDYKPHSNAKYPVSLLTLIVYKTGCLASCKLYSCKRKHSTRPAAKIVAGSYTVLHLLVIRHEANFLTLKFH